MKCPNCGATMKDGQLYCEKCGKEIQIVPDFEPEIENSIRATLHHVASEITSRAKEDSGHKAEKDNGESSEKKKKDRDAKKTAIRDKRPVKKKTVSPKGRLLKLGLAGILAIGLIVIGTMGIHYFQPGYQYRQALKKQAQQRYGEALAGFERAVSLAPTNVVYLNGLSGCYFEMGELEKAREICVETIALEGANEEAYKKLVAIYKSQRKYERINELMQNCKDRDIRLEYLEYLSLPPEVDVPEGNYQQPISVKLIGPCAGEIYYTLDGSQPTLDSSVYTNPIPMDAGSFTLKAFFVNQYGVRSENVTLEYYIDVEVPEAPGVEPPNGTYAKPHQIEIEVPEGYSVYYTTDKTDPDSNSTPYEAPLWMPVGHSTFRFVTVSPGGVSSEITERQYTFDPHPVLSMEAASNQLLLTLKNAGMVENLQGEVKGGGRNLYTYKYTLTINDHHYYFFREYYENEEKTSNATGNDYVVNYMSGECYQAVLQEDETFKLYLIESDDDDAE